MHTNELGKVSNRLYNVTDMEPEPNLKPSRNSSFANISKTKAYRGHEVMYRSQAFNCHQTSSSIDDKLFKYLVWHMRLGHLPSYKLKFIPKIHDKVRHDFNPPMCLACPLAKMTKSPFPVSLTKTSSPFELIR
ncbi:hypothetical protein vseg_015149 [Gypsophila vaccaria]